MRRTVTFNMHVWPPRRTCALVIRPPAASAGLCPICRCDRLPIACKIREGVMHRTEGEGVRPIAAAATAAASSRPLRFANDALGVLTTEPTGIDNVPQDATGWKGRPVTDMELDDPESLSSTLSRFRGSACRHGCVGAGLSMHHIHFVLMWRGHGVLLMPCWCFGSGTIAPCMRRRDDWKRAS